jgi:hypothetical protein
MVADLSTFRLLPSGPPLRPFWRYYGGKFRAAPLYPPPRHETIIEPFAGAAGYACRYPDRSVVLIEKYAVVAEMWRYLIATPSHQIRAIPLVENVADLPSSLPEAARSLVGFWLNTGAESPRKQLSAGMRRMTATGRKFFGWNSNVRQRVASQVGAIRHWKIIEGDYTLAPSVEATWFVDPPYDNDAGSHYVHGRGGLDYAALGAWCRGRRGQVIACENEGATWLPFRPFARFKAVMDRSEGSQEVIWTSDPDDEGIVPPQAHDEAEYGYLGSTCRPDMEDDA